MTAEVNNRTSGHKVEPKIEREGVPINLINERTERFFFAVENMSQGAKLKFIRENKGIEFNDIAE